MAAGYSNTPLTDGFGRTATMVQMINDAFTMTDPPGMILLSLTLQRREFGRAGKGQGREAAGQGMANARRFEPSRPYCANCGLRPFDQENRKTPINKPAANAQRPNVQAETTRTRIRRSSCGTSRARSPIAAAPRAIAGPSLMDGRHPATRPHVQARPRFRSRLPGIRHWVGALWCCPKADRRDRL